MSQRLSVGEDSEYTGGYDCILLTEENAKVKLTDDWLGYTNGFYLKPLKIRIVDLDLYKTIEPIIEDTLASLGEEYPDCIWYFYNKEASLCHPTRSELDAWLANV